MNTTAQKIVLIFLIVSGFSLVEAQPSQTAQNLRLPLTLTASNGKKFLNDLSAHDFEIFLENQRAEIESFALKSEPASVGFLIDTSASMKDERAGRRNRVNFDGAAFSRFLDNANSENDYFAVSFDKSVNIVLDVTPEREKVKETLVKIFESKMNANKTEFYNAIKVAYEKLGKSKNAKKVLILITDAQDNGTSKLNFGDITTLLKKENVVLYAIRVLSERNLRAAIESFVALQNITLFERDLQKIRFVTEPFPARENIPFPDLLKDLDGLVSTTGGRTFFPITQKETEDSFGLLAEELKSQYDLVIKTPADFKKNDFNEIKVKFIGQKDRKVGKVTVRTRKGFYL